MPPLAPGSGRVVKLRTVTTRERMLTVIDQHGDGALFCYFNKEGLQSSTVIRQRASKVTTRDDDDIVSSSRRGLVREFNCFPGTSCTCSSNDWNVA